MARTIRHSSWGGGDSGRTVEMRVSSVICQRVRMGMDCRGVVHTDIPVGLARYMSHNVVDEGGGDGRQAAKARKGEKIIKQRIVTS